MDDEQRVALKKSRVIIVENLEPKGEVLDVFLEDEVLTDNDVEVVTSQTSQKARCHKLLELLPKRGPRAFDSLLKALKSTRYECIAEKIESTLQKCLKENSRETCYNDSEIGCRCKSFLSEIRRGNSRLNETLFTVLSDNACVILHNVDPRDVIDQLIQDDVIDYDDDVISDIIFGSALTRKKCERLFKMLLEVQDRPNVVSCLIQALRKKYSYIADRLEKARVEIVSRENEKLQIANLKTCEIKRDKKFDSVYNGLSNFVNHGEYEKFQEWSQKVLLQFPDNNDYRYAVIYIQARKDLFTVDYKACKANIKTGLELARSTRHPQCFELDILSAKTRLLIIQKKYAQAQNLIEDTLNVLMTNPVGIPHKVSGWLHFNYARCITAQMACLNPTRENFCTSYFQLFRIARTSFNRAIDSFKKDTSNDGPFGFCYAICRLVILMLHCGDNGHFIDELNATEHDISTSERYLKQFEESGVTPLNMLEMQWNLARSDYQLRLGNYNRALDYALSAMRVVEDMNLLEFKKPVHHRLEYLEAKVPKIIDEVALQIALQFDDS